MGEFINIQHANTRGNKTNGKAAQQTPHDSVKEPSIDELKSKDNLHNVRAGVAIHFLYFPCHFKRVFRWYVLSSFLYEAMST